MQVRTFRQESGLRSGLDGDPGSNASKEGGRLGGFRVLVPQREEVPHVLGLEEALLPGVRQHLLTGVARIGGSRSLMGFDPSAV